jgi:hypothetical protein
LLTDLPHSNSPLSTIALRFASRSLITLGSTSHSPVRAPGATKRVGPARERIRDWFIDLCAMRFFRNADIRTTIDPQLFPPAAGTESNSFDERPRPNPGDQNSGCCQLVCIGKAGAGKRREPTHIGSISVPCSGLSDVLPGDRCVNTGSVCKGRRSVGVGTDGSDWR